MLYIRGGAENMAILRTALTVSHMNGLSYAGPSSNVCLWGYWPK